MTTENKIKCVLMDFEINKITLQEATKQILLLLNVVGQSESFVCGHPPKRTYLIDGTWHCEECGGKWESIANK
jgi:hypothetical protein